MKPYSESCDQNRDPILTIIAPLLNKCKTVLEIGSGTGQHAVYFAQKMPHLVWQCSDQVEYHAGIAAWLTEAQLDNLRSPLPLDVSQPWPELNVDAVFSANTAHIMSHHQVRDLFDGVANCLNDGGHFILYGPFNYQGQYTSASNARFDDWLKSRDPHSAIRDFEALNQWATELGLILKNDYAMPANNRILHWQKG